MKKTIIFLAFLLHGISSISVLADNSVNNCVYDTDIKDDKYLTQTCWFYDETGHKIIDPSAGYAGKTDIYEHILDAANRYEQIQTIYLDPEGNLMTGPDGYAKMTTDYILHESGPVCRLSDNSGDPANDLCGFTRRYFDENENPVLVTEADNGFHYLDLFGSGESRIADSGEIFNEGSFSSLTVLMLRNDSKYAERTSFFDTDGKPMMLGGVYAVYESIVDLTDGSWEKHYSGTGGELVDTPLGYAREVQTYSEDDRESFIRFYHANGEPAVNNETGIHAIHYFYGPLHRQVLQTDYLDIHDNLTNSSEGYSTIINEYMESAVPSENVPMNLGSRNPISTIYMDKDGNEVDIEEP